MGQLWRIVQAHIDASPYPPSERQVAMKLGISPTALSNWRAPKRLPDVENLRALARLTSVPYSEVLEAALTDTGYKEVGSDARSAPIRQAEGSSATGASEAPAQDPNEWVDVIPDPDEPQAADVRPGAGEGEV